MAQFMISALKFGTTVVPGVGQFNYDDAAGVVKPRVDGSPDAEVLAKMAVQHGVRFTINQVADMLALMASAGAVVGAKLSALTGGIVAYLIEADELGRVSGSTHVSLTMTSGVMVPVSLTLNQGEDAKLEVMILPVLAAGTDPVSVATNAAAPTVPEIEEMWTLGLVKLNGTAVDDVQSVSFNFGFDVEGGLQFSDGAAYPKGVFLQTREPVVSVTTRDADVLSTIAGGALALSSGGLEVFVTEVAADSLPTAPASSAHLKLALANGLAKRSSAGGSFIADTVFEVHGRKPGSGALVALSTGQAQS